MADASVYSSEPETKRKRTGKFCAVAECTGRNSDGISVHSFPAKDQKQRQQWSDFVRTCCADFGPRFGTPNNNSYICERHFTPESYPVASGLYGEFHIPLKMKRLKPGAVPTIQKHAFSHQRKTASTCTTSPSAVTSTVTTTMASMTGCCIMTTTAHSYPCVTPLPGVSTVRSAFAKRERRRVIADILESDTMVSLAPLAEVMEEPQTHIFDAGVQTEVSLIEVIEMEQLRRPKKYSRGVQFYPEIRHRAVQTLKPEMQSKSSQYNYKQVSTTLLEPASNTADSVEPSSELSGPLQDDLDEEYFLEDELSEDSECDEEEKTEWFEMNPYCISFSNVSFI